MLLPLSSDTFSRQYSLILNVPCAFPICLWTTSIKQQPLSMNLTPTFWKRSSEVPGFIPLDSMCLLSMLFRMLLLTYQLTLPRLDWLDIPVSFYFLEWHKVTNKRGKNWCQRVLNPPFTYGSTTSSKWAISNEQNMYTMMKQRLKPFSNSTVATKGSLVWHQI